MAYGKDGYPTELANKIGHIKIVQDPLIQRLIESFEDTQRTDPASLPEATGQIDLEGESCIEQVVVVDGSHQAVPNALWPDRQVGFVQVAAMLIKFETFELMRTNRMMDPRSLQATLGEYTHHTLAALPLAGVHLHGLSVKESIRQAIHGFFKHYELYDALAYLVYRKWEPQTTKTPSMDCMRCGSAFELPRHAIQFGCETCGEDHTLSDYLGLCSQESEDRPRIETISNLRSLLEALDLFSLITKFRENPQVMSRTLFLLDGPLLLRAELSRLVEPIRDLIVDQRARGLPLFLVGVEKSGGLRDFADSYADHLAAPGSFFLPGTKFLVETIQGKAFSESTYRNRVNYGAKVIARIGPDHVLALNVPTGDHLVDPTTGDLVGFVEVVRALSHLVSYSYDNALMPIVLANANSSISHQPSGGILAQFVRRLLNGRTE